MIAVANALFRGQDGLVLLVIDEALVSADVRYESMEAGNDAFPHIYGPLNLDAVAAVLDFPPKNDGTLWLPSSLESRGNRPSER